jgi:transposase
MKKGSYRVRWRESQEELFEQYRAEKSTEVSLRLHALWLLRSGNRGIDEVAEIVGVHPRSVYKWLMWYRRGGLEEIRGHHNGGKQGRPSYLTDEQRAQLKEQAGQGEFSTIWNAVDWVEQTFRVHYTYWGMRSLFIRLKFKKKSPRPLEARASLEAQDAWKKGDLPHPLNLNAWLGTI